MKTLVVAAMALGVVVGTAAPALAHNALTGSDPEDGTTIRQGPDEVRLNFLSSLDPDQVDLAVTGPDGSSVVIDELAFDGSQVTIPVRAALAGDYQVTYGIPSTDGHRTEGTIGFTVTEGRQPGPTQPASPSPVTAAAQPTTSDSRGVDGWMWALLAPVLLAAVGYGSYRWRRRRAA